MIRFDTIFKEAYSLKVTSLRAAKKLLEKYNFRGEILRVIEESKDQPIAPIDKPQYIYSRRRLRVKSPWTALEDGWYHLLRGFK